MGKPKLTAEQKEEIISKWKAGGLSRKQLAADYEISVPYIYIITKDTNKPIATTVNAHADDDEDVKVILRGKIREAEGNIKKWLKALSAL